MNDTLRIGWTRAEVASSRGSYRLVLGATLALHAVIGLVALFCPRILVVHAVIPGHVVTDWVRIGGWLLLVHTAFFAPGWLDPLVFRAPNFLGIASLLGAGLVLLCLGGWFSVGGVVELALGLLLGVLYWRLARSELMSLPGA